MKTTLPLFRLILLVAALLAPTKFVSLACADDTEERGELFATMSVPADFTMANVQEAIVNTLIGRQWGVKSKDEGLVVGYLKHRSNEAKVTLVYDTTKVEIYCVGWQINKKTGAREKPEQPKGWLKNIQNDLTKNFNRITTLK